MARFSTDTTSDVSTSLLPLLGEAKAAVIASLRTHGTRTASGLADDLGMTDVGVRKHLQVLVDEGFVTHEVVRQPRGRPAAEYRLTDGARALFPHRYAAMASELLEFLREEHGREGVRTYLHWRASRQLADLEEVVTADDLPGRLDQLAEALTAAGYEASVRGQDGAFELKQEHCAVYDVAKSHPEMCAHEAATFKRLLGDDVKLSRRLTLASGGDACVCTLQAADGASAPTTSRPPTTFIPHAPDQARGAPSE